eukprot:gb/GECG01007436.1/.p1 GENE.gb/GECG01007436.1/~~gb/GECG01007436.1/.p1  ORF type:complete len:193 (+),score=23.68 gb/GECG01007436.1/:1-579(+)
MEEKEATVALPVLETLRTAQAQNGLRHEDYRSYRQYCSRRLRRIRTGKQIKLTHGKGRAFVPKPITKDIVSDKRHLELLLFNAERAWAYALQLKNDNGQEGMPPRAHHHMMKRLRKAFSWAETLRSIAHETATPETILEAEGYVSYLYGVIAIEEEAWVDAAGSFAATIKIFETLKPQQNGPALHAFSGFFE